MRTCINIIVKPNEEDKIMKEPMKKEWKMDAYMSLKMLRNEK